MSDEHSLTLYEIEDELLQTFQEVTALQAEGREEDLAAAMKALEEYITASVNKRDRFWKFLKTLDATINAHGDEITRLEDKKRRLEKTRESLHNYVLFVMNHIGVKKLEGLISSFKCRTNPAKVIIDDEAKIPAEYKRQPDPPAPVPDKKAIKDALLAFKEVPGARLVQETRLVIDQ